MNQFSWYNREKWALAVYLAGVMISVSPVSCNAQEHIIKRVAVDIPRNDTATQASPSVSPDGVVSASGFGKLSSIAPGSLIEIYGSNLATESLDWGSSFTGINAPTSLGGTSVTIAGEDAYVAYISASQVNVQVPSGVPTGSQPLIVKTASGTSSPYMVSVKATEPGLLAPTSFSVGGKQYVAAFFSDNVTLALPPGAISGVPARRAQPGDHLTFYGIGFGPVIPNIPAGQIVQESNMLAATFQLKFGAAIAAVTYDGLAPSETGVYQFNATVPNIPSNDAVPLSFTLGGAAGTQTLYIAVQNGSPAVEVQSVAVTPNSVTGGEAVQGTVTLSRPAPSGGVVVALSSSSSAASVPATVAVPAGSTSGTFVISTSGVTSDVVATITVSFGGVTVKGLVTIMVGETLPQFSFIAIQPTFTANNQTSPAGSIDIIGALQGTGYFSGSIEGLAPQGAVPFFGASFANVSVTGQTFELTGLQLGSDSYMQDNVGNKYGITAGSVTVTLLPNGAPGVGSVSGTFTITSSLTTLSGTISGSYLAQ